MTRSVSASQPVMGSVDRLGEVLAGDPGAWLPWPARRRGDDRWTIDLVAGPLARSVACQVRPVWRVEDEVWRGVLWQPRPEPGDLFGVDRLLPVLRGELGLLPGVGGSQLVLRGSYEPPVARLGEAADAVALQHLAAHTAGRFLADVAARLAAAQATEA